MSVIQNNLLLTGEDGYNLQNSLRFRSSASAYLNRTPASAGNRQIWTWSAWVKRGDISANYSRLFSVSSGNSGIQLQNDYTIRMYSQSPAVSVATSAVLRDPSAWYHIVIALDTTQATSTNRVKIYINGVLQTVTGTYPSQNDSLGINNNVANYLGSYDGSSEHFDGYLAEVNFINAQALTPSSFGQTSATTGVWIPKKYTGTYGTNGFYLPFTDNSALTTSSNAGLGKDFSGNANYWTTNNISITSGSTYDSMTDVPTLTSATAANYCTWSPIDKGSVTVTNGNLAAVSAADASGIRGTIGLPQSGKWYWEVTVSGLGYGSALGIANNACSVSNFNAGATQSRTFQWGSWFNTFNSGVVQYGTNQSITGGSNWSGASQLATNDVLMIAVDMDNGSMWVGKNGTWFNSSGTANPATNTDPRWTSLTGTTWFPFYASYGTTSPPTATINFGQRPFAYTAPTGFNRLNTFNLPTPTIGATASTLASKYFDSVIWTGDQTNKQIPLNFTADFVWAKRRNGGDSHRLYDVIRGINKDLQSNATDAEQTNDLGLDFDNGNYLAIDGTKYFGGGGGSGITFVAWNWKANGSGVTNTSGSITSTVSANTSAGFSIVTYTGSGAAGTVGHGLGVAPSMIITKKRSNAGGGSAATNWVAWHKSLSGAYNSTTGYIYFNDTAAGATTTNFYDGTAMTSTTFRWQTGNDNINYSNDTYVAYCFAEVAGYSAFGSYTGNGSSDGTFVYTGFRPRYIMIKPTNVSGEYWQIIDTSRNPYNGTDANMLSANLSNAEASIASQTTDILSNGFKLRGTSGNTNGSGNTYIYMAFAENPFKYSLAR